MLTLPLSLKADTLSKVGPCTACKFYIPGENDPDKIGLAARDSYFRYGLIAREQGGAASKCSRYVDDITGTPHCCYHARGPIGGCGQEGRGFVAKTP